jgi:hypothetical protein
MNSTYTGAVPSTSSSRRSSPSIDATENTGKTGGESDSAAGDEIGPSGSETAAGGAGEGIGLAAGSSTPEHEVSNMTGTAAISAVHDLRPVSKAKKSFNV